ncbi:stress response kinase A [Marinobacterium nitratireducens]|uniref:Stress response kinase A n=1 Tax=Marinobacterium nitratireducens TaxID=518897 RepID=A0A918DVZ3_9GAMM|nr:serine/threonine protein kinase [Marinobacterium nitratireducens]GGO85816.1 stress response kinase A [Marinobacterium nitratireducens]
MTDALHPFDTLTPDFIIDAIEANGYLCDGSMLALNSYENRVYQVGIEGELPLIAKFYRPGRWSDQQIQEEHDFCYELVEQELPVVAPLRDGAGNSLLRCDGFRFALYPRRGGRAPEFDNFDNLLVMGRFLGRLHAIGARRPFQHRPELDSRSYGHDSVELLLRDFIPAELRPAYETLARDLLVRIDELMAQPLDLLRVHGDCHVGNVLWRDDTPNFVDFDDSRMAPAVQDIWMLLSGDRLEQTRQLAEVVDGYNEFCDFQPRELRLVEALRTLRIMHYSAWIARRWEDPAFPKAFTWFNTPRYWSEHILELREQFAALNEPPLLLM